MDILYSMFSEPIQSIVSSIVIVAIYLLLYLLLIAVLPKETSLIEQLFVFVFIVTFAHQVVEAFVILFEIIRVLQSFFIALIPVLSLMLLAVQSVFSIIAWNPIVILIIQVLLYISTKLLIPTLIIAMLLDLSTKIFPAISFSKAADLLRTSVLSLIIASVVGLTSILTFSGAAFIQLNDAVKSPIKKLIEQNIPLVGGLVVEGLSFFQKSQTTVSTFVGITFLMLVFGAAFYPAIVLLLHAILFKVIGAIVEPFTNARISGLFDDVGKTLFVLCAIGGLLGFTIVFIVLLCIIMLQLSMGGSV